MMTRDEMLREAVRLETAASLLLQISKIAESALFESSSAPGETSNVFIKKLKDWIIEEMRTNTADLLALRQHAELNEDTLG